MALCDRKILRVNWPIPFTRARDQHTRLWTVLPYRLEYDLGRGQVLGACPLRFLPRLGHRRPRGQMKEKVGLQPGQQLTQATLVVCQVKLMQLGWKRALLAVEFPVARPAYPNDTCTLGCAVFGEMAARESRRS